MASSASPLHLPSVAPRRRAVVVRAAAVVPEVSRLEPRVEKKDGGYWVVKEEFRQGVNVQEKVKLEREPMKLFMEGGLRELAAKSVEELDAEKVSKDDVDVRLKWLGLFHRRKHQYGRFMMRLKLPNGVTTSEQVRYLAKVIEGYGEEGCADITTRQNWQIRGVRLEDTPSIMDGLASVGLNSLQSGMDNVRNAVGNPLAGFDPDEIIDTRPFNELLSRFITGDGRGNPDVTNLPRKWNVCVVGSHDLYEHPHINDLAYIPAMNDGQLGFNLLVGGFISPKRWAEALPLDAWVPAHDVVPVCAAVLAAYRDLGSRGNRQKTRMMWLIDELGIDRFRAEVERRMPDGLLPHAVPQSAELPSRDRVRRDYLGLHSQKQPGFCFLGIHIPVGRLSATEMFELARLADEYGAGELRLTVEQNIIIPHVPETRAAALLAEPLLNGRLSPEPGRLMRGLVACTGSQFCGQAIIETKGRAERVSAEVERRVVLPEGRSVRIHWTGCPNSCAQVQVADIGLMGCLARDENGKMGEGVDVFLGGKVGADSHMGSLYRKAVPCKSIVPVLVDILVERFGAARRDMEEMGDDEEGVVA